MKSFPLLICVAMLTVGCATHRPTLDDQPGMSQLPLVTGRSLAESLTTTEDIGSLPINMVSSADGKFALTSDAGYRESLCAIRTADGVCTGRVEFPNKGGKKGKSTNGLYYGIAAAMDGTIYAAQGRFDAIAVLSLSADGSLSQTGQIDTTPGDFAAGLALDEAGHLFVTNNDSVAVDATFGVPGSVAVYAVASGKEIGRYRFNDTIAGTSNFPLAIAVALGRRSKLPAIRTFCTIYVELIRGVPLISVLFMASFMFPLFMPIGKSPDVLVRVIVGITLFAAAYMAEIIRGGLQALPRGQTEAAASLGLGYWQTQARIVLPQALGMVVPSIMNNFISVFKDTSLVTIVSLYELTGALSLAVGSDPNWRPFKIEAYLFIAAIYFICCFAMSRYSLWIERRLAVGQAR